MTLWDGLFAVDPTFNLAQWICVTMLVRIRNKRECVPNPPIEWRLIFS